jgi:hypothetical protein
MLGSTRIDTAAGKVHNIGADDNYLWTVRGQPGKYYLKGYPPGVAFSDDQSRCLFRNPTMGSEVDRIFDAVELPDGNPVVATNAGLRVYSRMARSWYKATSESMSPDTRLHLVNGYLIVEEPESAQVMLNLIPLGGIKLPKSCAEETINIQESRFAVLQVAVDEEKGEAAWLRLDGSVMLLRDGKANEVLAPPGNSPDPSSLRQVQDRSDKDGGYLLFTTQNELHYYNLNLRNWGTVKPTFANDVGAVNLLDIARRGEVEHVVVRTASGDLFTGDWDGLSNDVAMTRLYEKPARYFNGNANDVLDVQGRADSILTFVLRDRIMYFDPSSYKWSPGPVLATPGNDVIYTQAAGLDVIVSNRGKRWTVAQDYSFTDTEVVLPERFASYDLRPNEITAIDGNRVIWRLLANGELERSGVPSGNSYGDFEAYGEKPFLLNEGSVRKAFKWNRLIVFDTSSRLRIMDEATGKEVVLSQNAANFGRIQTARMVNNRLWLHDGSSILMVDRVGDNVQTNRLNNISKLVLDQFGMPWLKRNNSWYTWEGSGLRSIWRNDGRSVPIDLQLMPMPNGLITGIDGSGIPWHWADGLLSDNLPLPPQVRNATALIRGRNRDWWVIQGEDILHVKRGQCANVDDTCLVVDWQEKLGRGFNRGNLASASVTNSGLEVVRNDGSSLLISASGNRYRINVAPKTNFEQITDSWPQLRQYMADLANGQSAFNPITDLYSDEAGALIARRPDGDLNLASRGDVTPNQVPPLDLGWCRWDRNGRIFDIAQPSGRTRLPLDQAVNGGRFFFEEPLALLATDKTYHTANHFGIWSFSGSSIDLGDPQIKVQPLNISRDVYTSHEHFHSGGKVYDASGRALPNQTFTVTYDDVELVENKGRIQAKFTTSGKSANAFAGNGFAWDQDRRGIVFTDQGLHLHSGIGLHPVDRMSNLDEGPSGGARDGGRFYYSNKQLYFMKAGSWFAKDNQNWRRVSDPFATRVPIQNETWRWSFANNGLKIDFQEPAYRSNLEFGPDGPGFSFDNIRDAVMLDGKLYISSKAFFEIDTIDNIARLRSDRQEPVSRGTLRVLADGSESGSIFFNGENGARQRWDSRQRGFVNSRSSQRTPVKTKRLQISLGPQGADMALQLERIQDQDQTLPFNLVNGHFPFDVVNSIAVKDGKLYVGSEIGLQVYNVFSGNVSTSMNIDNTDTFLDLRINPTDPPARVEKIGVPLDNPNSLLIHSIGLGLQGDSDGSFKITGDTKRLENRLRVKTDFWRWVDTPQGLVGRYNDTAGTYRGPIARMREGRMPHDKLVDIVSWNDRSFSLWKNGHVSAHASNSLDFRQGMVNEPLSQYKPKRFLVLEQALRLSHRLLSAGVYLECEQGFRVFTGSNWEPLNDPRTTSSLREFADNPPIYHRENIRISSKAPLTLEQRDVSGRWYNMRWSEGRMEIDRWKAITWFDGELWAATKRGLVSFERDLSGQVYLDPDRFRILRELSQARIDGTITDLSVFNGEIYTRYNQDPEKVYRGKLERDQDTRIFKKTSTDSFSERIFVSATEYGWSWRLKGGNRGSYGYLEVTRDSEPVQLASGRFDFDSLNSLALFEDGYMELGTDLGGWYRAPRRSHHVRYLERQRMTNLDPLDINKVLVGTQEDQLVLGLQTIDGDFIRKTKRGQPERIREFREFQAQDSLWRYQRNQGKLEIVALNGLGGPGERTLIKGRFSDNWLLGLPVSIKREDALVYLLPTEAGVVETDVNLVPQAVHVPPFDGLDPKQAPKALLAQADGTVLYAGVNTLHQLSDRTEVGPLQVAAPDDYQLEHMTWETAGDIQVTWRDLDHRGWTRLRGKDFASYPRERLYVDLSKQPAFIENRIALGDPQPWLWLDFEEKRFKAKLQDSDSSLVVDLPLGFQLLTAIPAGERLLLIGHQRLMQLDLNELLRDMIAAEEDL